MGWEKVYSRVMRVSKQHCNPIPFLECCGIICMIRRADVYGAMLSWCYYHSMKAAITYGCWWLQLFLICFSLQASYYLGCFPLNMLCMSMCFQEYDAQNWMQYFKGRLTMHIMKEWLLLWILTAEPSLIAFAFFLAVSHYWIIISLWFFKRPRCFFPILFTIMVLFILYLLYIFDFANPKKKNLFEIDVAAQLLMQSSKVLAIPPFCVICKYNYSIFETCNQDIYKYIEQKRVYSGTL